MKVYLLIIEDRHIDVEVEVYLNKEKAINKAKMTAAIAVEYSHGEIEEQQIEGWLYFARYSVEGDCIRVEEKRVIE